MSNAHTPALVSTATYSPRNQPCRALDHHQALCVCLLYTSDAADE